jgi:UDP-N-acetylglucosamine 2-epimerase
MNKRKILTIVGARPQFIKLALVSKEIRKNFNEVIVHTGQHYDFELSDIFFNELEINRPDINLKTGSGSHGLMTGKMIMDLEKVFLEKKPDMVLIFGDTNSTLAASIAAVKLHIPIAHVEAGLRNFNLNRLVADRLSQLLFAPTETAVNNLAAEGISSGVFLTGDVMYDSILYYSKKAESASKILETYKLEHEKYILATIHRQENTENLLNLEEIISAFNSSTSKIIMPLHPRTKEKLKELRVKIDPAKVNIIPPVGYLDSIRLIKNAKKVVTDSGGIQREAYMLKTPCITVFPNTSWPETVVDGYNVLTSAKKEDIVRHMEVFSAKGAIYNYHYGDGTAGLKISDHIKQYFVER